MFHNQVILIVQLTNLSCIMFFFPKYSFIILKKADLEYMRTLFLISTIKSIHLIHIKLLACQINKFMPKL